MLKFLTALSLAKNIVDNYRNHPKDKIKIEVAAIIESACKTDVMDFVRAVIANNETGNFAKMLQTTVSKLAISKLVNFDEVKRVVKLVAQRLNVAKAVELSDLPTATR